MRNCLQRSPRLFGLARSRWWLAGIRQALPACVNMSLVALWRWLQRWGLHYKRGRQALHSPDPTYDLKLAYIQAALGQAQRTPEAVVGAVHG